MNTLKMVFVRIFSILFSFIKKLQTRNKQYTNKKLSLTGDTIMYTLEDLVMEKKYSTFSNSFLRKLQDYNPQPLKDFA